MLIARICKIVSKALDKSMIKVSNYGLGLGDLKYRAQWTEFNFPELLISELSVGMYPAKFWHNEQ